MPILSLCLLTTSIASAAQYITVEVPGGKLKGKVKKVTEKEVILILKNGVEQGIPIQFLKPEQIMECRKSMVAPNDAKALFDLGKKCFLNGDKKQAYHLFHKAGKANPSYRAKVAALLKGGVPRRTKSRPRTKKADPMAVISMADEIHGEIYYRFSSAVVGLNCKTASNENLSYYGTGAVITSTGLILTSTTVIPADPVDIKVYFTDGHVRPAKLEHHDPASEGVLLQLEEKVSDLPYMQIAQSDAYQPGDPVYSWGNPHNTIPRDGTVSLSLGRISGKYNVSSVDDQSRYIGPVIETDAAVNPGSDGGPLTDAKGNLLGIMSLGFSATRWLGLSIPTSRLVKGLPPLQKMTPVMPPKLTIDDQQIWARELAMKAASKNAAKATVGLWVVHEGETTEAPVDRKTAELQEGPKYPRGRMRAMRERVRPPDGCCSGFIVQADGTVITSAFNIAPRTSRKPVRKGRTIKIQTVTKKVTKIYAYLPNGKRVAAKVLGKNATYDLAVLKLQGKPGTKYPFIKLADKTPIMGASVALVGRSEPPGDPTLNVGTVSAVDRRSGLCVQMSALINYGNLGGPVVDLAGNVVGMASHLSINTNWRQNCGVGFCLRADKINPVLADLKAGKKIKAPQRPTLGITMDLRAENENGIPIKTVATNSAGAKAGLKPGDIITTFNGATVFDGVTLKYAILRSKVGQKVKIGILRGTNRMEIEAVMEAKK